MRRGRSRRHWVRRCRIAVSAGSSYPQPIRRSKSARGTCVLTFDEHDSVEVIWQQREFIDHHCREMTGNIDPAVGDDLSNVVRYEHSLGLRRIRGADIAEACALGSRPARATDRDEVRARAPVIEPTQPQLFSRPHAPVIASAVPRCLGRPVRGLAWPLQLLHSVPALVRIEGRHLFSGSVGVLAEVLFEDHAVVIHEERHDAAGAVLRWPGHEREAAGH